MSTSRISNGVLEAINSLTKAARARGGTVRPENFIAMRYLAAGKLNLHLPTLIDHDTGSQGQEEGNAATPRNFHPVNLSYSFRSVEPLVIARD